MGRALLGLGLLPKEYLHTRQQWLVAFALCPTPPSDAESCAACGKPSTFHVQIVKRGDAMQGKKRVAALTAVTAFVVAIVRHGVRHNWGPWQEWANVTKDDFINVAVLAVFERDSEAQQFRIASLEIVDGPNSIDFGYVEPDYEPEYEPDYELPSDLPTFSKMSDEVPF
jgi:hypothetical protein